MPLAPDALVFLIVGLLAVCVLARFGVAIDRDGETKRRILDDLDADRAEWARYPSPAPADTNLKDI